MNEIVLNYIIILMVLEVYEAQWQKAQTMMGMLARMYEHYQKNIFLFLIMHPSFYFAIVLMFVTNYNMYAVIMLIFKCADIVMKIVLLQQVFIKKELSPEFSLALLAPLHRLVPYIGIVIYPPMIFMAFVG